MFHWKETRGGQILWHSNSSLGSLTSVIYPRSRCWGKGKNLTQFQVRGYIPVKLKLQHPLSPLWAYPGHLTPFLDREGGNLITTHKGWGIWSLASMSCYESRWFHWVDKSWRRRCRRQTLMNSKEKIAYLWRIVWKPKAYTSCVPCLKVFKNDLYL